MSSLSVSTSASVEEDGDCCPLCSTALEAYDMNHPTQCPSKHCHFNFCLDCIEQFIQSTKDNPEASDGNAFHVFLHCPNCRSNLGPSIRDTVLLRKVDKYLQIEDDACLSASESKMKRSLERDNDIILAVDEARKREDEFFRDYCADDNASFVTKDSIWSQEGYEADLSGVPKSFISRHHSLHDDNKDESLVNIEPDTTLMCGLEYFMTDSEKRFVTSYLVSGDVAKLAAATEMLHYVSALSRQGITPNWKRSGSSYGTTGSMMRSIREVIREGNEARKMEEKGGEKSSGVLAEMFVPLAKEKRRNREQMNFELKNQFDYMSRYPLPLRMPKYAELTAHHKLDFSLTFRDDIWDGTVLDAFCKISVTKTLMGKVTVVSKQRGQSAGIRNIVDESSSNPNGFGQIDISRPRVIVSSISAEGGKQGIMVGDVVTHINGTKFEGRSRDLLLKINSTSDDELLTFAFNADAAVAEALRRRWLLSKKT